MPRLVGVQNPQLSFELPESGGVLRVGRLAENEVQINDPSVSGRHCEIIADSGQHLLRDLGSTNGTYVDETPVTEAPLRSNQVVRFGQVEFLLLSDGEPDLQLISDIPTGNCPNHPEDKGRWNCEKCDTSWCADCVNLRRVGPRTMVFCRACGEACKNADAPKVALAPARKTGFGRLLLNSLGYPLRKDGLIILISGAAFFLFLNFLAGLLFLISVIATGYWFAFLQHILLSSANGEDVIPNWPDFSDWWQDILRPAIHWTVISIVTLGPGLFLFLREPELDMTTAGMAAGVFVLGAFFLPMGLLATTIFDSLRGLNPLLLVISILRTVGPYLVVVLFLAILAGMVLALQIATELLPVPLLPSVLDGLMSFYFAIVAVRVLGQFYHQYKPRLQWFS